jgi:hypothetical protein
LTIEKGNESSDSKLLDPNQIETSIPETLPDEIPLEIPVKE